MADKEEVVFSLKVEQSDALTEMERFKKSILQTKQEQQELTKAYKQGNITLDEFVQDSVRLESILKKQQSSYNNVQKSVTGVKTQLDKLIDSNKKISKSFEDTAKEINVAGFNMGDLTAKMSAFANPATAAVGVVGALTAVYLKSTTGARDFAFAQDRLNNIMSQGVEAFGKLVGGEGGGGSGEGVFGKLIDHTFNFIKLSTPLSLVFRKQIKDLEDTSRAAAEAAERLRELEISRAFLQGDFKTSEKQAEFQRRIRDDETNTLAQRVEAAGKIEEIMAAAGQRATVVIQAQINAIKESTVNYENNREAQLKVAQLTSEMADVQEDVIGKTTENVMAVKSLTKEYNDLNKEVKAYIDKFVGSLDAERLAYAKRQEMAKETSEMAVKFREDAAVQQVDTNAAMNKMIEAQNKRTEDQAQIQRAKTKDLTIQYTQEEAAAKAFAATTVLNSLANLAEEGSEIQKAASLLSIAISTTEAVTKGIAASQSIPFPGNLAAMASTIAAVLGAIANAKSTLGFADGGWTGPGSKHQPAGIVHADEYVTPKHIVHSAAAQPHLAALERMRLQGYADGGLVTNSMTAGVNQNLMIANMMKHMPSPVVGVREFNKVANAVRVKESIAKRRS